MQHAWIRTSVQLWSMLATQSSQRSRRDWPQCGTAELRAENVGTETDLSDRKRNRNKTLHLKSPFWTEIALQPPPHLHMLTLRSCSICVSLCTTPVNVRVICACKMIAGPLLHHPSVIFFMLASAGARAHIQCKRQVILRKRTRTFITTGRKDFVNLDSTRIATRDAAVAVTPACAFEKSENPSKRGVQTSRRLRGSMGHERNQEYH